jgi:predicted DNA-binding ribbon-helix-helix protein
MAHGAPFAPPVKRSVTIAGHETSVALEPMFWAALEASAARSHQPLNAVVARIDAERLEAQSPPNLASALRQWLFRQALDSADDRSGEGLLTARRDVEP